MRRNPFDVSLARRKVPALPRDGPRCFAHLWLTVARQRPVGARPPWQPCLQQLALAVCCWTVRWSLLPASTLLVAILNIEALKLMPAALCQPSSLPRKRAPSLLRRSYILLPLAHRHPTLHYSVLPSSLAATPASLSLRSDLSPTSCLTMLDPKWTGTDVDRREMGTLDLQQVVRRNFGSVAMFGFSSTLLCTWEVIITYVMFPFE
jgi:hypothetical protein